MTLKMAVAGAALFMALAAPRQSARYDTAPEFPTQDPEAWVGPPQSLKALAGRVVILDVWTFG